MKASKNWDEVCYPFIHETSVLCDFEVVTDEWCTLIGMAYSATPPELADIAADLAHLQPLAFHVNGSIRGKLAVQEVDVQWVLERIQHYRSELGEREHAFVLPRGTAPVPQLHRRAHRPRKRSAPWCVLNKKATKFPTYCRAFVMRPVTFYF